MPMITLVYCCLFCMAAIPFTHQQGQLTNFTVNGHSFFLSNSKKSYSDATTVCENTKAELALFDTNDEYFEVLQQLSLVSRGGIDDIWVHFLINETSEIGDNGDIWWWKDEKFNTNVWFRRTLDPEPNQNCDNEQPSFNPSDCCARIDLRANYYGLRDRDCNTGYYFLCKCSEGFRANVNGECNDFDECTENVCSGNLLCKNTIGSYYCDCPPGFNKTLNNRCQNIDECQDGTHQCEQICHDTDGSYTCSCQPGYGKVPGNDTQCRDINECKDGSHNCSQMCHDTLGGFTCSCNQSYVNASNDHSNCTDRDECVENLHNCQQICNNTEGSFECSCYSGYQLNSDGSSCDNINECLKKNSCEQLCNDSDGSYKCDCRSGYVLSANGFSCQEINRCLDGSHNCEQNCSITQGGGYTCSCYKGYLNISDDHSQCEDIDECKDPHTCQHICNNTDGSFGCFCRDGFVLGEDGVSCEKVDECKDSNSTECPQSCNNTNGSDVCGSKGEPTYGRNSTSLPSSFVHRLCVCPCKLQSMIKSNITQNYVRKLRDKITKELLMPTYNLSAERRRKTSAQDDRPSSQSIGCIGITFMAVILGFMFFCDILSLFKARHR